MTLFQKITLYAVSFAALFTTCTPTLQTHFCTNADVTRLPELYENTASLRVANQQCRDALSYAPDTNYITHRPMRYIRVNVHFVNSSDSSKNFLGQEAIDYAKNLVGNVNKDLSENAKMYLPIGNDTPVLPTQYRLKITRRPDDPKDNGIYFHFDEAVCYYVHKGKNRNLQKRDVINKYGVQLDSVLNIFIMPHHPDSVASPTYAGGGVGVALGTSIKMAGMYESKKPFWQYRQILSHEVAHVFGLQHTWAYNDGCEDTPKHPNCWNRSKNGGPCDSLISNNLMDYNAWQKALTPCQIGRLHRMMSNINSRPRKLLLPTWCTLNEKYNIEIRDSVSWRGDRDIEGHLRIKKNGILKISCRLSLPKAAVITIEPGGKLILQDTRLHNACGDQWKGIEIQEQGNAKGELVMIGKVELENMDIPIE